MLSALRANNTKYEDIIYFKIEEAVLDWRFNETKPDFSALLQLVNTVPDPKKAGLLLRYLVLKGLVAAKNNPIEGLMEDIQQAISHLDKHKGDDENVFDALISYIIALPGAKNTEEDQDALRKQLLERIGALETSPLEKDLLLNVIEYQIDRGERGGKIGKIQMLWLLDDYVRLLKEFGFREREAGARQREIDAIAQLQPVQRAVLANREESLASLKTRLGDPMRGIALLKAAEAELDQIAIGESGDASVIGAWRLKLQSNTAWDLIQLGSFKDALQVLETSYPSLKDPPSIPMICDLEKKEQSELVHVYQNFADTHLALGNLAQAVYFSRQALSCAISKKGQSDMSEEWFDATKTLGVALIADGKKIEGRALISSFTDHIKVALDDKAPPQVVFISTLKSQKVDCRALAAAD